MGKYSFNFNYIAQKLNEVIEVNERKEVRFKEIFLTTDLESILESAYDFNAEITESEKSIIIEGGINYFALKAKKDGQQLKTQIKKKENEYLKKPLVKYSILSSFSFPYFKELPTIRFKEGVINFYNHLYPKKYKYGEILKSLDSYSKNFPPRGYVPMVVNIRSRNITSAMDKGIELLDFVRGIWNYSINNKTPSRIFYGKLEPINIIRLGPTHILCLSNGSLATDLFWYETSYFEKSSTWDVGNKWNFLYKEFIGIRKSLNKLPYKKEFSKLFVRYANALDNNDYENSYLKLWSLLEFLTDTINSNYDKTISRAMFFYRDDILSKEIIEHLRIIRNRVIHFGEKKADLNSLLFQIKRIVEDLIWQHLNFAGDFKTIEEFGRFLDLSKERKNIESEVFLRKKALKFLYK